MTDPRWAQAAAGWLLRAKHRSGGCWCQLGQLDEASAGKRLRTLAAPCREDGDDDASLYANGGTGAWEQGLVRLAVKIYSAPADLAAAMLGADGGIISTLVTDWQLGEGTGGAPGEGQEGRSAELSTAGQHVAASKMCNVAA